MVDIVFNPDASLVNPDPAQNFNATTWAEAKALLASKVGGSNFTIQTPGVCNIYVETNGTDFIQERMQLDDFACNESNYVNVIFRNQPDLREPLNAPAGNGSTVDIKDAHCHAFGETGIQDFVITVDPANTNPRTIVSASDVSSTIGYGMVNALLGGEANPNVGGSYVFGGKSIHHFIFAGCGLQFYGAYRNGSGLDVLVEHVTIYKCATFRPNGASETTLKNSAVFETPFYTTVDELSDYNASSQGSINGSTASNNLVNLLASDCFVDADSGDFSLKLGSPLIAAGYDSVSQSVVDIGAMQSLPASGFSFVDPDILVRAAAVTLQISNASADGLSLGDFSLTLEGHALTLSNLASTGANAYAVDALVPANTPLQHGLDLYDLVLTENGVSATVAGVTLEEPANKDFIDLADGLVFAPQWVAGNDYSDAAIVFNDYRQFSRASGSPITNSQIAPVAGGVDGWIDDGVSSLLHDGQPGTHEDGVQVVYDHHATLPGGGQGGAVVVNANNTFTVVDPSPSQDQSFSVQMIAPDGTLGSEMLVTIAVDSVADAVSPVIQLIGSAAVSVAQGAVYNDAGATATDNIDGDITSNIQTVNNVDTSTFGAQNVTYTVSDAAGNAAATVTRTVNVVAVSGADTTIPVITLIGPSILSILQGDNYSDSGATATDNIDGDITSNIQTVNNVDTSVLGAQTITYSVSDAAGNVAITRTRVVNVVEEINIKKTVVYFRRYP
ncbi:MAG: DUF5011 domain-containing protein [Cellvibrionaceae bacterium]